MGKAKGKTSKAALDEAKAKKAEEEDAEAAGKKGKKKQDEDEEDNKPIRKGKAKHGTETEGKKDDKKAEEVAAPAPVKEVAAAAPAEEEASEDGIVSGVVAECDALRKKGNFLLSITVGSKTVQVVAQRECEVGAKVKVALEGATLENGKTVKREKIAGEWSEGSLIA